MRNIDRTQVFISYSHRDREWVSRLRVHLRPLVRESTVEVWDDSKISPGSDWTAEIGAALARCKVAVILVSADFFDSDFVTDVELPLLLDAAEAGEALLIPLLVSPSSFYRRNERLSRFQAANPLSKTLIEMTTAEQESVFERLAERIELVVGRQELRAQLTDMKQAVEQQQDIINRLVVFSMSFHIFDILSQIYHRTRTGGEYLFQRSMEEQLRFLRDHGYINWIGIRNLQPGQNLIRVVTLTPAGNFYVELREAFQNTQTNA